jgi:polar amino acid transport system substrate-binding protein
LRLLALAAAVCLAAAACSSNGPSEGGNQRPTDSNTSSAQDNSAVALVPAAVKAKGTLTVAVDASYAPDEFIDTDGKTIIGMNPDLTKALGDTLGLKVSLVNVGADAIIPGLQSGKYDLSVSSWTDNKDREQAVDFVTYYKAGTSFMIKTGTGVTVNTLDDLCGKAVGVEKSTTQLDDITAQNTTCKNEGKAAIDIQVFPDQNAANLALTSARVQVGMADSPVAAYQVKLSNNALSVVGQTYGTAPYGIAIPKDSGMTNAVLAAVKALMAHGSYAAILDKWGLADGAISDPVINGAVN